MTNFAARSPLPGEDDVGSGAAPAASGAAPKPRPVSQRRSSGKKADEPSVSDDTRRVAFSLPVSVADRIIELAAERGQPRSEVARSIVERGLHMEGTRVLFPGGPGRPDLEHVGQPPPDAAGELPEIPSAYVAGAEPSTGSPPREADAGEGAVGLSAGAAEPVSEASPGSARSAQPPDSSGPGVPLLFTQPRSMFEPRHGLILALVLLVGFLGIAASLGAPRYAVAAPDPGAYGAGVYLVDRWTGRLWFCDSATRGLPERYCAPFRRSVLSVAPSTVVE